MIGTRLQSRYRLISKLGDGGMGAVFEAADEQTGQRVAVKMLHVHLAASEVILARFRREAEACTALSHPNIVRVTDFQANAGEPPFLVMELLRGVSLGQVLAKQGAISVHRAADIATQVLSALDAAHRAEIVHRDLKPSNIVHCPTPEDGARVKLVDFGVAKLLGDSVRLTGSDAVVGTAHYMSPEQVLSRQVDARTDVYGLGATLYHAVSGSRPFKEISRDAVMSAVCNLPPIPLAELNPAIDRAFVAIVERAMSKRPADRFGSAGEMAQALSRWAASAEAMRLPEVSSSDALPLSSGRVSTVADRDGDIAVAQTHPSAGERPAARDEDDGPPGLPKVGDVLLGKFRIERVVGRGGMGIVYAAHHELLDQTIALKLLLTGTKDPSASARFVNEAKMAARIRSEHVCRVIDVGVLDENVPYIAMELLAGVDLGEVLARRKMLPVAEAVDYVLQALEALAHAHALKIVHRDLKPANFFVSEQPSGAPLVKVLDFGISKSESFGHGASITTTGAIIGSPAYMAPEQIKDSRLVDVRADIWSLGVVLYELLLGECPFSGDTLGQVFANIFSQRPNPFGARRADVPPGLEAVVFRCLEQDRDARFADVAELAGCLLAFGTHDGRHGGRLERIQTALGKPRSPSSPELVSSSPIAGSPFVPAAVASSGTVSPWADSSADARSKVPGAATRAALMAVGALVIVGALAVSGVLVMRARVAGRTSAAAQVPADPPIPVARPAEQAPSPANTDEGTPEAPAGPVAIASQTAVSASTVVSPSPAPSVSVSAPATTTKVVRPAPARNLKPPTPEEKILNKRL